MNLWLPAYALLLRELRHFTRDRTRLIGVLLQPAIFFLVIGSGLNASFQPAGFAGNYLAYFLPGILLMVVLFTSIYTTYSIIEDRREGFLHLVLAAPVSPLAIVLGKVAAGVVLGTAQALLMLPLMLLPSVRLGIAPLAVLELVLWLAAIGVLLTGFGVGMAWKLHSSQGYHSLMTVVLFPSWLFSGAAFPAADAPLWLRWLMTLNPLSHGLALLRHSFGQLADLPLASLAYLAIATLATILWAAATVGKRPVP